MWNELFEELILEILTRLPTKSLLRFRTVSKSLCALIGSPGFIRLHTLRSPHKVMNTHQVRHEQGKPCKNIYTLHSAGQLSCTMGIAAVEYPFPHFQIIGSCNGILCVYQQWSGQQWSGITLWNPSIRRKVAYPSLSDCEGRRYPIGFGFHPITDDYKILMRVRSYVEEQFVLSTFVYTVKTNTWREIASPIASVEPCQCLFNGSLYWLAKWYLTDSYDDHLSNACILTFDLGSELFSRIELPEPSWKTHQVTVINGCLALISSSSASEHDDTWIWLRRECTWSVAFKLNKHEYEGDRGTRVFQHDDDLLLNAFYGEIVVYNSETKARSKFVGFTDSSPMLSVTPCVESLELLDMGASLDQITRKSKRKRKREDEQVNTDTPSEISLIAKLLEECG